MAPRGGASCGHRAALAPGASGTRAARAWAFASPVAFTLGLHLHPLSRNLRSMSFRLEYAEPFRARLSLTAASIFAAAATRTSRLALRCPQDTCLPATR